MDRLAPPLVEQRRVFSRRGKMHLFIVRVQQLFVL